MAWAGVGSRVGQAALYHARERRRSFTGQPDLHQTHSYAIPTASIPTGVAFPTRTAPITLATRIRIVENGGVHRGLIFELGGAGAAMAAWLHDTVIAFRAGSLTNDRATAIYVVETGLEVGRTFNLVFACRPATAEVRFWDGSESLGRAVSVNGGPFPAGWGGINSGSFATGFIEGVPADVTQTGAPDGFVVEAPLRVFDRQLPRHFG